MRATSDARTWSLCRPVARPLVRDRSAKVIGGAPCRSRLGRHGAGLPQGCDRGGQASPGWQRDRLAYPQSAAGHGQRADWLGNRSRPPRVRASRDPAERRAAARSSGIPATRRNAGSRGIRAAICERPPPPTRRPSTARIADRTVLDMRGPPLALARRLFVRRVPLRRGHPVQSRRLRRSVAPHSIAGAASAVSSRRRASRRQLLASAGAVRADRIGGLGQELTADTPRSL